ncbi:MAG: PIG-L deacetylase family protein [Bacillota bacterium]
MEKSRLIRPPVDLSLRDKRLRFDAAYNLARTGPVRRLLTRAVAPDSPELALALGERLARIPRRVLALTAHEDDLEFFAGGTLRRMARAGSRIHAVVLSDGEKRGNWTDLADKRVSEQRRAARLQGYESVQFMGLPDFGLPEDPRLEHLVARAWDQIWPEVVFAFDPKEILPQTANRDHKALGRTVADLARARFHTGAEVYFYGTRHPDVLVEITGVMAEKLEAVLAHQSQMVLFSREETAGFFQLLGRVHGGSGGVRYAEPFFRLM